MFRFMKPVLALSVLAAALSACSAHVTSDPIEEIGKVTPPNNGLAATYLSDCQNESGMSYRVRVDQLNSGSFVVSQTVYGTSYYCIGSEPEKTEIGAADVIVKKADAVTVSVTGNGMSVDAKKIESRSFTTEIGLSVAYVGKAGTGSEAKEISSFAQIVSHPSDFPWIWTQENGVDVHPRSNPWVWSGARTSSSYSESLNACEKIEVITVAAGRFMTCLVEKNSEKVWYGNVPLYGIVKYEKAEGVRSSTLGFTHLATSVGLPETAAVSAELSVVGY